MIAMLSLRNIMLRFMRIGAGLLLIMVLGWLAAMIFPKKAEQEIYLLPEGYIGPVIVVLEQPRGVEKKYDGGTRVYDIPMSGILYSQFTVNSGVLRSDDVHFYYQHVDGTRTEIPFMWTWTAGGIERLSGAQRQVVTARDAGFGTSINKRRQEFVYASFVVGPLTQDEAETLFRRKSLLIDRAQEDAQGLVSTEKRPRHAAQSP
jgi:hypothetical protein